jgi:hypothetical protein
MGLLRLCSSATIIALILSLLCSLNATLMVTSCLSTQENPVTKFEPSVDTEVTTISFCDLLRDPAAYNKKVVRMSAILSTGFEVSRLENPACPDAPSMWAEFGVDSCTKSQLNKTLEHLLRRDGSVEIVIIGQFNAPHGERETRPSRIWTPERVRLAIECDVHSASKTGKATCNEVGMRRKATHNKGLQLTGMSLPLIRQLGYLFC